MTLKERLQRAIRRVINAEVANSWKGGGDSADCPAIEKELRDARKALRSMLVEVHHLEHGHPDDPFA